MKKLVVILLMLLVATAGCERDLDGSDRDTSAGFRIPTGSDKGDPPDASGAKVNNDLIPSPDSCNSGAQMIFTLSQGGWDIPYPSNLFTSTSPVSHTGISVNLGEQVVVYLDDLFEKMPFLRNSANKLDGFGISGPIWFPASRRPAQGLFPDPDEPKVTDAIFCAVLENEGHPKKGELWPIDVTWEKGRKLIRVAPHLPFFENTTYACVITEDLLTSENECYESSEHFRYVSSRLPDPSQEQAYILNPVRKELAPWFNQLRYEFGVDTGKLISATVFTTIDVTTDLLSIRDQLNSMATASPPEVDGWELYSLPGGNIDSVWETTYDTVNWRHKGVFIRDENRDPIPGRDENIELRLHLPADGVNGFEPPYPVIVYGHGINSSIGEATGFARHLCGYGFAVAAINWTYHGDRGPSNGLLGALEFMNVFAPLKIRDNMRQGVADVIWLKHLIRTFDAMDMLPYDTGGDGIPDLDTERIYYFGNSFGSIHGGIIAAVEPDFEAYLLYTGAAELITIALESDIGEIGLDIVDIIEGQFGWDFVDDIYTAVDIALAVVDGGDPYSFGPYVQDYPLFDNRDLNLLLQIAAYDETVSGEGSAQLARTMGLTLAIPYAWKIEDIPTAVPPLYVPAAFQYDTSDHGFFPRDNEIGIAARIQAEHFLRSVYETGQGEIIDGFTVP